MVKDEKNKYLNSVNKNYIYLSSKQKFILPNKDFKKFSLDSNKVCKSGVFWDYI